MHYQQEHTIYGDSADYEDIKLLLLDPLYKNIFTDWVDKDDGRTTYSNASSSETYYESATVYTVTYYPLADFKRKMFICTNVEYDSSTGRITAMYFTEKT